MSETTLDDAMSEIKRLRNAIRRHRDQCGDDRCWLDDQELYGVLQDHYSARDPMLAKLPSKCEFLESCSRFWEQRQSEFTKKHIHYSQMTIKELEVACAKLAEENEELKRRLI